MKVQRPFQVLLAIFIALMAAVSAIAEPYPPVPSDVGAPDDRGGGASRYSDRSLLCRLIAKVRETIHSLRLILIRR
jgi:hypothetical protein